MWIHISYICIILILSIHNLVLRLECKEYEKTIDLLYEYNVTEVKNSKKFTNEII